MKLQEWVVEPVTADGDHRVRVVNETWVATGEMHLNHVTALDDSQTMIMNADLQAEVVAVVQTVAAAVPARRLPLPHAVEGADTHHKNALLADPPTDVVVVVIRDREGQEVLHRVIAPLAVQVAAGAVLQATAVRGLALDHHARAATEEDLRPVVAQGIAATVITK